MRTKQTTSFLTFCLYHCRMKLPKQPKKHLWWITLLNHHSRYSISLTQLPSVALALCPSSYPTSSCSWSSIFILFLKTQLSVQPLVFIVVNRLESPTFSSLTNTISYGLLLVSAFAPSIPPASFLCQMDKIGKKGFL